MVSYTTVLICAKCGTETKVRSDEPGPLEVTELGTIRFRCPHCNSEYQIQDKSEGAA